MKSCGYPPPGRPSRRHRPIVARPSLDRGNELPRRRGVRRPVSRGLHASTKQPARMSFLLPPRRRRPHSSPLTPGPWSFRADGAASGNGTDRLVQRVHLAEPGHELVRSDDRWGRHVRPHFPRARRAHLWWSCAGRLRRFSAGSVPIRCRLRAKIPALGRGGARAGDSFGEVGLGHDGVPRYTLSGLCPASSSLRCERRPLAQDSAPRYVGTRARASDSLATSPTLIAPGDRAMMPILPGPRGTRWVVVHARIGSTPALGETEDWLQVPFVPMVPMTTNSVLTVLGLELAGLGLWVMLRRTGRATRLT
jgi:hypothetical protein